MPENNILIPEVRQFLELRASIPKKERLRLPMWDTLNPTFLEVAKNITALSGTWNPVEIYTADPDDIRREKAKIFEAYTHGNVYNPHLTYSQTANINLTQEHNELEKLLTLVKEMRIYDPTNQFAREAFIYKIRDDLATCHLVKGINNKDETAIKNLLKWKYPGTDPVLMKLSQGFYEQLTITGAFQRQINKCLVTPEEYYRLQERELSPEEQKEGFTFGLAAYGILRTNSSQKGYKIIIDERATSLDVRDKTPHGPALFVPTQRATPMTAAKFLPLLAHEVEGHARQSMIGQELFILGGGPLKIDDEQLYEGYAIRMEEDTRHELFGVEKKLPRIYYPFAVFMAEHGATFYEIFSDQVQRRIRISQKIPFTQPFPPFSSFTEKVKNKALNQAWRITYRVMRGHIDMINHESFAMAKDLGYLRGRLIDRQLQAYGYGHVNECAVIPLEGLPSFARFDFSEADIPKSLRYKNVTKMYLEKLLKP